MTLKALRGAEITPHLDAFAVLRIEIFREWPYLYDGDFAFERRYLEPYATSSGALVVGAFSGGALVGAATATPMEDHAAEFSAALAGQDLSDIYYFGESVLLPAARGRGLGHGFFDAREAEARRLGRSTAAFCAVVRPEGHPLRPEGARNLEPFWRGRGYAPLPGAIAHFPWKDVGSTEETVKPLQFWTKAL